MRVKWLKFSFRLGDIAEKLIFGLSAGAAVVTEPIERAGAKTGKLAPQNCLCTLPTN